MSFRALAHRLRNLPIGRKLMLLVFISSVAGLLLAMTAAMAYSFVQARASAERDLRSVAEVVAGNSTAAMAFGDLAAAQDTLSALSARPEIERVCLYTDHLGEAPALFGAYATGAAPCPAQPLAPGMHRERDHLVAVVAVRQSVERIGLLQMYQSLRPMRQELLVQTAIMLAILGLSLVVSLVIGWAMQRSLTAPILALSRAARRVKESGNYDLRVRATSRDEIGHLVRSFNDMVAQVGVRERQIEMALKHLASEVREKTEANRELAATLDHLKRAQMQLVQAERLASLGNLVAGVAHEINTPVGISVTAASTLCARAAEAQQLYASQQLTRPMLDRFMEEAIEYSSMLLRNLERAADLVHSFKRIAVDQSSGERRKFDLKDYIEEILVSLQPTLKKTAVTVEVDCEDKITLDSYPGAFAQILSNLVGNSLVHAYDEPPQGRLLIRAASAGGRITLRYSDDGRGIPPEHLARIFDPFFTTRRNAGGSGLGLHIVHNLVSQLLGGTIEVHSAPGHGTAFTLNFPAVAPAPGPAVASLSPAVVVA